MSAPRWVRRFRRLHGPTVRYWGHDWNLLATEPSRIESWPAWLKRQWGRAFRWQ